MGDQRVNLSMREGPNETKWWGLPQEMESTRGGGVTKPNLTILQKNLRPISAFLGEDYKRGLGWSEWCTAWVGDRLTRRGGVGGVSLNKFRAQGGVDNIP